MRKDWHPKVKRFCTKTLQKTKGSNLEQTGTNALSPKRLESNRNLPILEKRGKITLEVFFLYPISFSWQLSLRTRLSDALLS